MKNTDRKTSEEPKTTWLTSPFIPLVWENVISPLLARLRKAAACEQTGDLLALELELPSNQRRRRPAQMVFGIHDSAYHAITNTPILLLLMAIHGPDGPGPLRYRLERIPQSSGLFSDGRGGHYKMALVVEQAAGANFGKAVVQYAELNERLDEFVASLLPQAKFPTAGRSLEKAPAASHGEPSSANS